MCVHRCCRTRESNFRRGRDGGRKRLWVVYDAECGLCTGVKDWIGRQAALVPLEFVAAGSVEAQKRFPQLPAGELAVVGDTGEVWLGEQGVDCVFVGAAGISEGGHCGCRARCC